LAPEERGKQQNPANPKKFAKPIHIIRAAKTQKVAFGTSDLQQHYLGKHRERKGAS